MTQRTLRQNLYETRQHGKCLTHAISNWSALFSSVGHICTPFVLLSPQIARTALPVADHFERRIYQYRRFYPTSDDNSGQGFIAADLFGTALFPAEWRPKLQVFMCPCAD